MSAADDILIMFIERATELYGPRHLPDYSIARVIVRGDRFAETYISQPLRTITVRITVAPEVNLLQSSYQLAHEAVHCLIASGRRDTIWFEEGLGNYFALQDSELPRAYRKAAKSGLDEVYRKPFEACRELMAKSSSVKEFRAKHTDIDKIEPSHIRDHFGVSDYLAEKLCRRMPITR